MTMRERIVAGKQVKSQSELMETAHSLAGGKKDVAVYLVANENAIAFYEKLGMRKADDVMEYNHIEWTEFTVK